MALDTLICGMCEMTFNDIGAFVEHKREGCKCLIPDATVDNSTVQTIEQNLELPTETANVQGDTSVTDSNQVATAMTSMVTDTLTGEPQTVIIIQSNGTADQTSVTQSLIEGTFPQGDLLGQISNLAQQLAVDKPPSTKKRRGRRKKEDKVNEAEPPAKKQRPSEPEKLSDGKLQCKCCKRTFTKERFFKTHKCMPTTDYVDVTKKEVMVDSDENDGIDLGGDSESDFDPDKEDPPDDEDYKIEEEKPLTNRSERNKSKDIKEGAVKLTTDLDDNGSNTTEKNLDPPIFSSEEDKAAFEQSLNVDLSMLNIDHMFRQHMIEQDLNDKAPITSRLVTNSLSLYSCNTCDKIFKTVSHMRLHCLIHTDMKPFKCPRCPYASNAKGNLYTHMRKHTGQFYNCKFCDFKSVNKSHVLEHEAIHSGVSHQCNICHHDYNTLKSLINHVRKYHSNTKKGEEYLASFLQGGRQRGTTVIHQCHVCNRKFKKKIDRDRHLYVHDIRDIPNVQNCELCDYSATRRVYLEKHFQKHRVIYRCVQCEEKFCSTIRLIDHLTSVHLKDDPTNKWESLFEECIGNSLYLPEPDESLTGVEKQLVNLPAELSTSSVMVAESLQNMDVLTEAQNNTATEPETENGESSVEKRDEHATNMLLKDRNEEEEVNMLENGEDQVQSELEESSNGGSTNKKSIIESLGYRPMTLHIFHKMRETFGHEECPYCGKLHFNKIDYDNHVRSHTGDKPFPCSICGFRAQSRELLTQHKDSEHGNATFPCKDCEFEATSRTQLWNHGLIHAGLGEAMGIECPECHMKFDNLKRLNQHVSEVHSEAQSEQLRKMQVSPALTKAPDVKHKAQGKMGRRSYKCPYCDRVFIRANSELQKHIWIHEGIKPYKCPLCTHACRSKNNLQAHMLRHTNEKPYTCPECNKGYKSKTALRWHVRSHKAGKLFKCTKCPYEATQSSHLRRHMETHNVVKRFLCQHCDYSSNSLSYLKMHYTKSHKGIDWEKMDIQMAEDNSDTTQSTDSQTYKCLSCDYHFGNLTDLKRHLKVRHHFQVKDLQGLEPSQSNTLAAANPSVQYVQLGGGEEMVTEIPSALADSLAQDSSIEEDTSGLENNVIDATDVDERTASAVNLLQQIFSFSNQASLGQQFTVQSENGEVVSLNPETIIVQQEGEEVMVADGETNLAGNQQYVIQYLSSQDGQSENVNMVEVIHSAVEGGVNEMSMELDQTVEGTEGGVANTLELEQTTPDGESTVMLPQPSITNDELERVESHVEQVIESTESLVTTETGSSVEVTVSGEIDIS